MNSSLMLPLTGPSISGSVQVPLAELDQMRVNHANAVRMVEEMKEKRQMVWVTITTTEGGTTQELADWKNLDEVAIEIKKKLESQHEGEIARLNTKIKERNDTIARKNENFTILEEQIGQERIGWNEVDRENRLQIKELKADKKLCLTLAKGKSNLLNKRHGQIMDLLKEKVLMIKAAEDANTGFKWPWAKNK